MRKNNRIPKNKIKIRINKQIVNHLQKIKKDKLSWKLSKMKLKK